ncbi:hypothetical protein [Moraxella pluranimalium]|uniref:Uncharacterized protein n=1 Tax=Moraxella pluranimalium TaxID=470453 RepID=A0A1T0CKU2_9GAMM|nr:hypothetical protein [Moraxella pluranimalium]OOS22976.1 hypothetical protein B0680_08710 [Moraxella pluranimalium]
MITQEKVVTLLNDARNYALKKIGINRAYQDSTYSLTEELLLSSNGINDYAEEFDGNESENFDCQAFFDVLSDEQLIDYGFVAKTVVNGETVYCLPTWLYPLFSGDLPFDTELELVDVSDTTSLKLVKFADYELGAQPFLTDRSPIINLALAIRRGVGGEQVQVADDAVKARVAAKFQNRIALGMMTVYVAMHPELTLADLKKQFPMKGICPDAGIEHLFFSESEINELVATGKDWFVNGNACFTKDGEWLVLGNGDKVAFNKMWSAKSLAQLKAELAQFGIVGGVGDVDKSQTVAGFEVVYTDSK